MNGSRVISPEEISTAVEELAIRTSTELPRDVEEALQLAAETESVPLARYALRMLVENARIAQGRRLAPLPGYRHVPPLYRAGRGHRAAPRVRRGGG